MQPEEASILFVALASSFGLCVSLGLLWRHLVAPLIPAYKSAGPSERIFLAASFVSLYPACTAPLLALAEASTVPLGDNSLTMTIGPSPLALRAVGISCGYMVYDAIYCLMYEEVWALPSTLPFRDQTETK